MSSTLFERRGVRWRMPVALLLTAIGCQDAVPPSGIAAASPSRAGTTKSVPTDGPVRYAADVSFQLEAPGFGVKGPDTPQKRPSMARRFRIERERTPTGEWLTTVDVPRAFPGVPARAGAESHTIGRIQVNETTGATVVLSRAGQPIALRPGFDPAGVAATARSFGRLLEHAIVTPEQAARTAQSLRASLGEPLVSGDVEVYRRAVGASEIQLTVDARTGLTREELQRDQGRTVARTSHRYELTLGGRFVRAETRTVREGVGAGPSTYVVILSDVTIDGEPATGSAP